MLCLHCIYSVCINKFSLHAAMLTRAQLLKSKLPQPDMSTSPSGLVQAEDVRSSHPKSVQEFDVIPDVMNYISHLGVTPKRFKPVGYGRQHVRFCFAIWVCICLSLLQSCCLHMQFQIVFSGSWVTGLFEQKASLMDHHRCCTCLVCFVTQCLQSTVKFYKSMQLPAREAAVERLWEPVIVDPTNSLTNYHFYSGENNADRCSYAYWQPQGNTTETHSEIVRTESTVLACCQHFE